MNFGKELCRKGKMSLFSSPVSCWPTVSAEFSQIRSPKWLQKGQSESGHLWMKRWCSEKMARAIKLLQCTLSEVPFSTFLACSVGIFHSKRWWIIASSWRVTHSSHCGMLTAVSGSIDPFEKDKIQRMGPNTSLVWNTYFVFSFSLNNLIHSQLGKRILSPCRRQ